MYKSILDFILQLEIHPCFTAFDESEVFGIELIKLMYNNMIAASKSDIVPSLCSSKTW